MSKCYFESDGRCNILTDRVCTGACKFQRTEEEFYAAQKRADEILRKKGLQRVITSTVVTTRRIRSENKSN